MVIQTIVNVNWGVDKLQDVDPNGNVVDGVQLTLLDDQAGVVTNIPFSQDHAKTLIRDIAKFLKPDDRKELLKELSGGIVIASSLNGN